jgi:hypothetical protein
MTSLCSLFIWKVFLIKEVHLEGILISIERGSISSILELVLVFYFQFFVKIFFLKKQSILFSKAQNSNDSKKHYMKYMSFHKFIILFLNFNFSFRNFWKNHFFFQYFSMNKNIFLKFFLLRIKSFKSMLNSLFIVFFFFLLGRQSKSSVIEDMFGERYKGWIIYSFEINILG